VLSGFGQGHQNCEGGAIMSLRERIIHESLKLFSLNGFLSTSVSEILDAANTSKGGFYNHFASKEDLFYQVLDEARRIWREKTLFGLDEVESPIGKIQRLLENYRDRYLKDDENFPGGCVFVTFSVELDDQRPHLCKEVNKGFVALKGMINRILEEGREVGELSDEVDTSAMAEMLFAGMLGASVIYGVDKSADSLNCSINSLIDYLEKLRRHADSAGLGQPVGAGELNPHVTIPAQQHPSGEERWRATSVPPTR
jgi:AcrR family transcriptional regulator